MNTIGSCGDCGREWFSHGEAHCASCCAHFSSDSAFDRHLSSQLSDVPCHPPETIFFQKGVNEGKPIFAKSMRASGKAWRLWSDSPHPFASKPTGEEIEPLSEQVPGTYGREERDDDAFDECGAAARLAPPLGWGDR